MFVCRNYSCLVEAIVVPLLSSVFVRLSLVTATRFSTRLYAFHQWRQMYGRPARNVEIFRRSCHYQEHQTVVFTHDHSDQCLYKMCCLVDFQILFISMSGNSRIDSCIPAFLADRTYVTSSLWYELSPVCLFVVCHGCIVAKRCEIKPTLLLITNRNSHIGFQVTWKLLTWMT